MLMARLTEFAVTVAEEPLREEDEETCVVAVEVVGNETLID